MKAEVLVWFMKLLKGNDDDDIEARNRHCSALMSSLKARSRELGQLWHNRQRAGGFSRCMRGYSASKRGQGESDFFPSKESRDNSRNRETQAPQHRQKYHA